MTVLQVCAYAAPYEGNFIKSLKELGKALKKKNIKMIYAFPERCREIKWCKDLEKQTSVYYLPLAKARIKPATYKILKSIFSKHSDISVIHSHFELYDVPVSMTAPKNVKVFWHLHDAIQEYTATRYKIEHKLQYGVFYKNAVLLSVSEKHMEYAISKGFPRENTRFVANGLDTDRIKLVDNSSEKEFDFLMFGWEIERKGVDLCIEAVKKLDDSLKVGVVGIDKTREDLEARYGKNDRVEVIAPVDDINELYGKSRCFLHISRAEGLSYALLEAIYAGLPVVCSDISENAFAESFPTVAMIKNEDIDDIAKAMKKQLDYPVPNKEDIDASRKIIKDAYSVSCWVKHIMAYYGV